MKKIKKLTATMLAVATCFALSVPCFAVALPSEEAYKNQAIEIGTQKVVQYIEQREAEYYNIESIDYEIYNVEESLNELSFDVVVTIMHELKADKAEDLPFVQGMLCAMNRRAELSAEPAQKNVFNDRIAEIDACVDEITRMMMYFNVSANIGGASITNNDVQIFTLDSSDNKVDVSEYDVTSYDDMFNQGYRSVEAVTMESQAGVLSTDGNRLADPISNYDDYDRIAARDYAYEWWGPNDSNYNPAYSNWNNDGGDCANFVSQCIKAGGVDTDGTWYKDSPVWISTSKLAKYMVDNGYATAESYLDTNAGNFATKPGHSVLVTINNTVDVCYTAHNTNRKDAAFTNTELNSTYTFYVIKNY